jgi:tetrahydromethanopterin S-methyltransferase subunit B
MFISVINQIEFAVFADDFISSLSFTTCSYQDLPISETTYVIGCMLNNINLLIN